MEVHKHLTYTHVLPLAKQDFHPARDLHATCHQRSTCRSSLRFRIRMKPRCRHGSTQSTTRIQNHNGQISSFSKHIVSPYGVDIIACQDENQSTHEFFSQSIRLGRARPRLPEFPTEKAEEDPHPPLVVILAQGYSREH
jgi:hypothetical protein